MNTDITVNDPEKKGGKFLIPKRVTIETIFGCNANCVMCPSNRPTKRKKGVMPVAMFNNIIDSLIPYRDHFEMMDLYCLGEPLLDPHIFDRIRYVKAKGFRNVAISTNADLLDVNKQKLLLESGIDSVLFSIDGVKKTTHESIRSGVDFDRVVENCQHIIKMRDEGNYPARFVIRFIRQDINRDEWQAYQQFWGSKISRNKRDFITAYDVHSWGGEVSSKKDVLRDRHISDALEKQSCNVLFDILYILSDGSVPLCNKDWLHPIYNFGNVKDQPALQIFNCKRFNQIREIHLAGNKNQLDICRECTVMYSLVTKEIV